MNKAQKIVTVLSVILMVIVITISVAAILTEDGGAPYTTVSLRGEEVQVYGGDGQYAFNSVDMALMARAFDWFFLFTGIPVMIIGLLLYLRRSAVGYIILLASFFLWIYNFFINSISMAHNDFFLAYMAVYVIAVFAVVAAVRGVSHDQFKNELLPKMPVRLIAVFNFLFAAYFIVTWLITDFTVLFTGSLHPNLEIYTTAGLNVADLSIYVPVAVTAGVMALKRNPLGIMVSAAIILLAAMEMAALSLYLVISVIYTGGSAADLEIPIMVFVPVCLVFGIISLRKLKGAKYALFDGQPISSQG